MGRKVYSNEFKVTMVELLNSGRSIKELSEEYQLNDSMLRKWRKTYQEKSGDFSKKKELSAEQKEIIRLKKALRDAEIERDILKKAVSIFSVSDK